MFLIPLTQARAMEAEQETENAFKQIERLKKKQKTEASPPTPVYDKPIYDTGSNFTVDYQPKEEYEQYFNLDKEPTSWFSGKDTCNI